MLCKCSKKVWFIFCGKGYCLKCYNSMLDNLDNSKRRFLNKNKEVFTKNVYRIIK